MRRMPALVAGLLAALSVASIVFGVVLFSDNVDLTFGHEHSTASLHVVVVVTIYGLFVAGAVFAAFAALAYDERGAARSPLLMPRVFGLGSLYAYFLIQAARAYDLFVHDFRAQWTPLYQPEVTIFALLLLIGFLFGKALELAVILVQREHWDRRRVVVTYAAVAGGLAATLALSLRFIK
jgi:hypothetical protein